jgi:hypothetical protein
MKWLIVVFMAISPLEDKPNLYVIDLNMQSRDECLWLSQKARPLVEAVIHHEFDGRPYNAVVCVTEDYLKNNILTQPMPQLEEDQKEEPQPEIEAPKKRELMVQEYLTS